MPQQATLINEQGQKVVADVGSQQAQAYFGQGYQLMGSSGQYQPQTPTPAVVPTTPTAPPTPVSPTTAADAYGVLTYETPEEKAFRESQGSQYKTDANAVVDENAIRTNTLSKFQSEIDALNRVYAEKKRVEQLAGQGRMGGVAAVGARRGLIGSDFGVAQENQQADANTQAYNAIESERLAKESAILSEARGYADAEIKAKTEAKRLGAENYLKYIAGEQATRGENVKKIIASIYSQGLENPNFDAIAKELGVSASAMKAEYDIYKKEQDSIKAVAEQEANKKAEEAKAKQEQDLLKEGYLYIKTPAERDALRKQGYNIVEIKGRTYGKKPTLKTTTMKSGSTNYLITTDEMGNVVNRTAIGGGGTGTVAKSSSTVPKASEKTAIDEMTTAMSEVVGGDGFIAPDNYTTLRNQWIGAGLSPTTFDTKFKGFRNPNNPNYIINKQ